MRRVGTWQHLGLGLVLALSTACRSTKGPCPPSADRACTPMCPAGASRDQGGVCACTGGAHLVAGGCVGAATADAYCGKGGRSSERGCDAVACPPGERRDVATGACLGPRAQREIAGRQRIDLFPGEILGCARGLAPVVDDDLAACVPAEVLCPRNSRFVASTGACAPGPRCGAGEVPGDRAGCVPILGESARGAPYTVDVARWARAHLGPNGGVGSPILCRPLALRPRAFGLEGRGAVTAHLDVELLFPDNDVSQAYARWVGRDEASERPLPQRAVGVVEEALEPLLAALRAVGGEALTGAVKTQVRCAIRVDEVPYSVPAVGESEKR